VASRRPGVVTSAFKKADREGRVMIDPSRNAPGATFVAPFSPRARAGARVSFPVIRDELNDVEPSDFTVHTVPTMLDRPGPRAWADLVGLRQRLPSSLVRP
jgi:DNA primase